MIDSALNLVTFICDLTLWLFLSKGWYLPTDRWWFSIVFPRIYWWSILFLFRNGIAELPTLPSELLEMEVANNLPLNGLPPHGHKPTKKEAKLLQQRLEHLAKVNIHLHGKGCPNDDD